MTRKKKSTKEQEKKSTSNERPEEKFPVVGIGASAGGLSAFEAFFSAMPTDTDPGMAFVLVQHLAPDHKSILTDLVQRYTSMQVFEVKDGMRIQPNCAYIIPPNRDMALHNSVLQLMEPSAPRGQRLPIDFFFRSMAQDQRERAICIVLSGTGSDGTQGVRAVKGEGGMVMVQKPESTEYDGMPRSAIATGLVDYELIPAEMPAQLIDYVKRTFGKTLRTAPSPALKPENTLRKIFILLRTMTGHDFSEYKQSTISRRIERRMAINQIETLEDYVKYLQQNQGEVDVLFNDMLIGVTSFFREPEAFKALEEQVIQRFFSGETPGGTIRVWVPGCATGEEAYSIAIQLAEHQETIKHSFNIQVFATDIDSQAISVARAGIYPAGIAADITEERLSRFFTAEPGGDFYRIHKAIRDLLVFSEQDMIKDPPFSRLDLISCRNLLIYMSGELQKKLIPLFHYALNPGGFLFLGTSETVGDFNELFNVLDRKFKIYQCKPFVQDRQRIRLGRFLPHIAEIEPAHTMRAGKTANSGKPPLRKLTEEALLQQVSPVILVNSLGDILYIHGRTGLYLENPPGESGVNNIIKMAREGLRRDLTAALHKAVSSGDVVRCPGLRVKTNGDFIAVNMTICPVAGGSAPGMEAPLYLVILEKTLTLEHKKALYAAPFSSSPVKADSNMEALKQELRNKEEHLQSTIEELETSNEELKSSNEEMQSVNEELQSTNEELETSKEELQSVNEELATVNAELQSKVSELSRANNDMNNLLAGTGIGTVFVDHQLRILRFTPSVTNIINLIKGDVGRPVGHIVSNLTGYDSLVADIQAVLDSLVPKEMEVRTKEGTWYTMRILPYRTLDNVIEGAVLTFVDITEMKKFQEALRLHEENIRIALQAAPITVYNQDSELRYTSIHSPNPALSPMHVIGKTDDDLFQEEEAAGLTAIKRQVLKSGKGARREVRITIDKKQHFFDLTIEPMSDAGRITGINCAAVDITDRRMQETQRRGDKKKMAGQPEARIEEKK